jgi:hypothetical protein
VNEKEVKERATRFTLQAKRITLQAVQDRINQDEGFKRAHAAATAALMDGKDGADVLVAAGDAFFAFVVETCGVEKR